jgi:hypothetical protein
MIANSLTHFSAKLIIKLFPICTKCRGKFEKAQKSAENQHDPPACAEEMHPRSAQAFLF